MQTMQTSLIIENLLTNELSTHIRTLIPTHPHTHTHTHKHKPNIPELSCKSFICY